MTMSKRTLVAVGAVAVLWLLAIFLLLPVVVSDAYAGHSMFGWLNRAIEGQSQHPLVYYQSLARRAALLASVVAVTGIVAGVLAWRFRATIAAYWHRTLTASPTVGAGDVVATGAWIGWLGGLAEAISLLIRYASDPHDPPVLHALWLAPLSAACLGALAGGVLAVLLRAWRGVSVTVPVAVFSAGEVYAVVAGLQFGIHPYALIALCIGAAIQLGRLASRGTANFSWWCRRSLPWMGAATVGVALLIAGTGILRERAGERLRGRPADDAPNVLLLILDTVRAQDLSLYGYPRETSPQIDRLASTGVTFDRAIAPTPWTLPSHASMFTGVPPDRLSTNFHSPLDAAHRTIAEVLRERGYATGGFVANLTYTSRVSGLNRGFPVYRDHPVSPGLFLDSSYWMRQAALRILPALDVHGRLVRKSAAKVNDEFLSWMPSDGTPFFAFVNYFDAHLPYKLESPFSEKFRDPAPRYWRFRGWVRDYAEADLQEFRDAYNSAIAYIDDQVGALLRELEQQGVLDNTLVVVASDHGEHFGEHGGIMTHGNSLYLPLLHVPLVISFPSRIPAGVRVQPAVSLQDIPATILDVLGFSADSLLPGESLAQLWNGSEADGAADAVFSELTFNDFSHRIDPIRAGPMQSLVQGRLHYIRNGDGREEVYDFVADPDEQLNLAANADSSLVLAPFRELLAQRDTAPGVRPRVPSRRP
jgi:arylsulfatase A-like enzyme